MKKKLLLASLVLTFLVGNATILLRPKHVLGADATNWKAGFIIGDGTFTDSTSMNPGQIQDFLNQKVGTGGYGRIAGQCDTNGVGTSEYGGGTRAQYGAAHGNPAPFTCLKDFYEVPKTAPGPGVPANNYGGKAIPTGAKSAAQIIYDAAQTYNISPKVLLVTIQKESAGPLTTDDWPFLNQYTYAMGAHCPDTAACDENYAGFSIQIYESARLFRYYLDNMGQSWWPYKKPGVNNILYNPNTGCGGSDVNIESKATAALYTYTPYQPNKAALDNLYGSGDSCSAYGNRNFWRIFTDWFGSPTDPPFAWQVVANRIYDENKYSELDTSKLRKGERIFVSLKVRNTGTEIWYRDGPNPATLGTVQPYNHISPLCDKTWLSCDRAALIKEASVYPGYEGHFEFYAIVPDQLGEFRDFLAPVLENRSWMYNNTGYHVYVKSNNEFSWSWGGVGAWSDPNRTVPLDITNLSKGQYFYVTVRVLNTSATIWQNNGPNPVSLGTFGPIDRKTALCAYSWYSCNRAAVMSEASVGPGQYATFSFLARAPYNIGEYREFFKPVSEFKSWMTDDYNHIYLKVTN
jgi:hypothetical protein